MTRTSTLKMSLLSQALSWRMSFTDAEIGQDSREFSDASRAIGDGDGELDQTTVDSQTAFQTASQHRRIDVAAAQRHHHSFSLQFGQKAGQNGGQTDGTGAFYHRLLDLHQPENGHGNELFGDGD